jgi:N-glycosylase/DNA lyase
MSSVRQGYDDGTTKASLLVGHLKTRRRSVRRSLPIAVVESTVSKRIRTIRSPSYSKGMSLSSERKAFHVHGIQEAMTPDITDETTNSEILSYPRKTRRRGKLGKSSSISEFLRAVGDECISNHLFQIFSIKSWIDLEVPPEELRPSSTLTTGQCFHWIAIEESSSCSLDTITSRTKESSASAWGTHRATAWIGVLEERVLIIKETANTTLVYVVHGSSEDVKPLLRAYFQLQTPLAPLYEKWSVADPNWFARLPLSAFQGVRVLEQDPVECLFSFLCSSNNNIPRITKILANVRKRYGKKLICNVNISNDKCYDFYSFPTLEELRVATEAELRLLGLGYRAPFIIKTRDLLLEKGGKDYLLTLRGHPDANYVQRELLQLAGVGRKVADCVALFSLGQVNVVPVDTHVLQIAVREYRNPSEDTWQVRKSMTPTIYAQIGNLFRTRFATYTGWAHSVLFVAELPSFRDALPEDLLQRMDEWKEQEKVTKKER